MQIARIVLPTINQWYSQGPPKLFPPRLVPCDPMTNSSGNTTAVSQPQPLAVQPPHSPQAVSGTAAAAPLSKVGLVQSNFTLPIAEPLTAP